MVLSNEDFYKHLSAADAAPIIAVDTETTGLRVREGIDYLMGISIAYTFNNIVMSVYFPFRHQDGNLDKDLLGPLGDLLRTHRLVFHNAPFDLASLRTIGIVCEGEIWDTQVMAHMYNENLPSKELDWLSTFFLKDKKTGEQVNIWARVFGWATVPAEFMAQYAAKDAELTLRIFKVLYVLMKRQDLIKLWGWEDIFIKAIVEMEKWGLLLDKELAAKYAEQASVEMKAIEDDVGFAPSGRIALQELLFDKLGMPVLEKTDNGEPSLNKHVMEQYDAMLSANDNPLAQKVLAYRGWQRSNSACYLGYPKLAGTDGRVHASFKIFGTKTGRLSCVEPNLQQIPRRSDKAWDGQIKNLFIPSPGYQLWEFDYGQLEFRLASLYGSDDSLLKAWKADEDPYQQVADTVGITRQQAKTLVLSMLYGAGEEKIAYTLRISNSEAAAIRANFRRSYPGLKRKMAAATTKATEQRFIQYWTGRKRHFTKFNPGEEHKAFNSVLQGGGFEIVKRAICKLLPLSNEEHRMVLTIHDSILFEIKEELVDEFVPKVIEIMENSSKFSIPFKVEAKQWGA
jgi:DNA polymerase-1